MLQSRGVNIAKLAVKFSIETPDMGLHLLGCDNIEVLNKNMETFKTDLTTDEQDVQKQILKWVNNWRKDVKKSCGLIIGKFIIYYRKIIVYLCFLAIVIYLIIA